MIRSQKEVVMNRARLSAFAVVATLATSLKAAAAEKVDRTVLPIPEPNPPVYKALDACEVKPPLRFEVTAPENAPNVLLIMIDDMGFGMSSAFGGPIHMPTAERLSHEGLRYNHFHTTALCELSVIGGMALMSTAPRVLESSLRPDRRH
jgi:hypothetical protein